MHSETPPRSTHVAVSEPLAGVLQFELNRPEKLNALDRETLLQIYELTGRAVESDVRCVLVTGAGRAFCAGADLSAFVTAEDPSTFDSYLTVMLETFSRIARARFVSIAAIQGVAFGGGLELALSCDLRVMAEDARLAVPEILLGALPGGGAIPRLLRTLPPALAKEMVLTGRQLSADEALNFGVVNHVVSVQALSAHALELAGAVASHSSGALTRAKKLFTAVVENDLESPLKTCRVEIADLMAQPQFSAEISAFLTSRQSHRSSQ